MNIPKISALFETSLASAMSAAATSFTLVSATDRDGNALSGRYGFIVDEGTADEEFVIGTVSSTTVTVEYRGIDADAPNTEVSANKKAHRRGASVKITDYPIMGVVRNILNGEATIPNLLQYASGVTPTSNDDLADKEYVDGVAVAGASNANTTTKGIVEEATQAEVDARTTAGGTGAKLFAPLDKIRASKYHDYAADAGANDTYVVSVTPAATAYAAGQVFQFKANTVNTGACSLNVNSLGAVNLKMNKDLDPVTGYIKAGQIVTVIHDGTNFQILSVSGKPSVSQTGEEIYAADAGANDTYAITLTPAPVAYVTGMVVRFKANTVNTGACSLNVNALGAITIKKNYNSDLADGDIAANQLVEVIYDGTNFQLLSPVQQVAYKNGTFTAALNSPTAVTITHGLGKIPKKITITGLFADSGNTIPQNTSVGAYDGTNQYCAYLYGLSNGNAGTSNTSIMEIHKDSGTNYTKWVATMDATNITLTPTVNGTTSGNSYVALWEAEG